VRSSSPDDRHADVVRTLLGAGCVFAEEEARLLVEQAHTPTELGAMLDRRVAGLPLEQILGWAEFCGRRIAIDPGVFVPRRRTEFLVQQAVRAAGGRRPAVVVDLCCGSGAVGVAVAAALGEVELHAVDIDPAAVTCARRNLTALGGQVRVGDLYDPLPQELRGRVDLLVACAPYVPTRAIELLPPESRDHEPRWAVDGGVDGLDVQRPLVLGAPPWLALGGSVLLESSEAQAAALAAVVDRTGLVASVARSRDLNAVVVSGTTTDRSRIPGEASERVA
jgi:release factor glutamine methyltransferase